MGLPACAHLHVHPTCTPTPIHAVHRFHALIHAALAVREAWMYGSAWIYGSMDPCCSRCERGVDVWICMDLWIHAALAVSGVVNQRVDSTEPDSFMHPPAIHEPNRTPIHSRPHPISASHTVRSALSSDRVEGACPRCSGVRCAGRPPREGACCILRPVRGPSWPCLLQAWLHLTDCVCVCSCVPCLPAYLSALLRPGPVGVHLHAG